MTGKTRIMDLVPQSVPVLLGSPDDVREMRKYYDALIVLGANDSTAYWS